LAVSHGTQNTSVSCVALEPGAGGGCSCDFYNRTPHLVAAEDDKWNRDFYMCDPPLPLPLWACTPQWALCHRPAQLSRPVLCWSVLSWSVLHVCRWSTVSGFKAFRCAR
jgi:hypothetical protein